MKTKVGYAGWIGHNNVGDEALLEANKKLFNEIEFVDAQYWDEYNSLLFGGGTILPQFLVGGEPRPIRGNQCTAAIGVGIRSPNFWNQRLATIDFRYLMGRVGYPECIRNKYIEYLLQPFEELSSNILSTGYYFSNDDYMAIEKYNFDYLGTRGPLSGEILSKYGIDHEVIGDTALVLEPSSDKIKTEKKVAVCLQHDKLKWAKNEEYIHHIVNFLKNISNEYKIICLPFQKEDLSMHIKLSNILDNAEFKNYCSPMDVQGVIDEIASCELMIGEKLHANILSSCSHTPFISLEYRPKCFDFASSVNMDKYNIRIDEITESELESMFIELENKKSVKKHIETEVEKQRNNIRQFTDKIEAEIV